MRPRSLYYCLSLCASASVWAQAPLEPAAPPVAAQVPAAGRQMPAPAPVDVALDDSIPLEGEELLSTSSDGAAVVRKGIDSPFHLSFAGARYVPLATETIDPKLVSEVKLAPTDGRPEPTSYGYVMFSKRITQARIDQLEALGVRVLGQHSSSCLAVALPPRQIDTIAALSFVRWIGSARNEQKVHPTLLEQVAKQPAGVPVEMIVNVFESDLCADTVRELITSGEQLDTEAKVSLGADTRNAAFRTHSNGWQQLALQTAGVDVVHYTEKDSVRAFHVRAPAAALENLVALDFVQFVEQETVAAPNHDESMPLVYSDSTRYYYTGGTSAAVVAGEVDSGISAGHADLYWHLNGWGWDFSGSGTGAWNDACGHGTHVAGTITGDGSANFGMRGNAPGLGWGCNGRFQLAKIFSSCSPQVVDLAGVMGVMRAGSWDNGGCYTPKSHVINNSWGSGGGAWIGSEYQCRLIDDEVFWQRQMYVFAAGNNSNASSINIEAGAKNAFSVGSVDDFAQSYTTPGERSWFSSQGPMGDGRFKPNICAPGNTIRSLAANTWDQYTDMSGTSMASPHVTGIAAQLCDQYPWLRYSPPGLAALMMASAVTRDSLPITSQYTAGLNQYGCGRVESWLANFGSAQTGWSTWVFDLGAGQGTYADFYVAPGTTRVVVCMNWNEQASSAGASKATINDWDLYIDYEPFTTPLNSGEYDAGVTSLNNTEIRYIDNPPVGWFRWKLYPYSTGSMGEFGVTVFGVSGGVNPSPDLTLSQTAYYAQVGQPVEVAASVYCPSYLASATYVDTFGGSYLNASYKYLNDSGYCDMLGNMTGGRSVTLGDILSFNSRTAYFQPVWLSEGTQAFTVYSYADNGATDSDWVWVTVDSTPPTAVPSVSSPTHLVNAWNCDSVITTNWSAASDALAGVAGYSVAWDGTSNTVPDIYVDTTAQSWVDTLADGGPYYFHVRAVDYAANGGPTKHLGPFYINSFTVATYCTGKTNSQGCVPTMSYTGHASVAGANNFHLKASNVLNNKQGLLFWGTNYANAPFQGGTKCVANPTRRTVTMNSGGSPSGNNCTGTYDYFWTQAYSLQQGLGQGQWIYCQFWYRDPADPFTIGLSNATQFLICDN